MTDEYQFKIDGPYKPATIPMGRLAAYMAALANLLGEEPSVHFDEVKEGSAILVAKVDTPAQPKVHGRMQRVRLGDAPQDAQKAFRALDDLLAADNATGRLTGGSDNVIEFPGVTRPKPIKYGPVKQEGTVEGRIVRIPSQPSNTPTSSANGETQGQFRSPRRVPRRSLMIRSSPLPASHKPTRSTPTTRTSESCALISA